MNTNTATLIGATGLIGSHLLKQLISDNGFEQVRLIVRRPVEFEYPGIDIKIIDFEDQSAYEQAIAGSSVVFCTVGTTQQKVGGDLDAYRKIDHDIPVNAATHCKNTGCETFILVSSVGAELRSRTFYLKLKGEVEYHLKKMDFNSLYIMQPSMLLGHRKEFRMGERIMQVVMKLVSGMLIGDTAKFKPIHVQQVASAMIAAAKQKNPGVHIWTYADMKKWEMPIKILHPHPEQ
jgi:uncharacterized protein YbjT (DUF2867 family)